MRKLSAPLFIWVSFMCFQEAQEALANEDLIPGSRYTSARAAAMGDAFIPIGDDIVSGLFYNPANLALINRAVYEPVNLSWYTNSNFMSTANSNIANAPSLTGYATELNKESGKYVGMGGQFVPTVGLPWASFGLLINSEVAGESNGNGTYNYRSLYQLVPTIGNGWEFNHGMIRFGYSLQWVNEAVGSGTAVSGSGIGYNQGLQQGSGFSSNAGLGIVVPLQLVPSFNFVFRNIGGVKYSSSTIYSFTPNSSGTPADEPMTIDASFSMHPRLRGGAKLNFIVEERDVTNQSGQASMKHLSIGFEYSPGGEFFLRAGCRDVAPSAGIGIKKRRTELSISYFTEDVETIGADSRLMVQYQFRSF